MKSLKKCRTESDYYNLLKSQQGETLKSQKLDIRSLSNTLHETNLEKDRLQNLYNELVFNRSRNIIESNKVFKNYISFKS